MDPFFILDTPKSFEEASASLQVAVVGQGFGVLAAHDLGHTLRSKTSAPTRQDHGKSRLPGQAWWAWRDRNAIRA